MRFCIPLICLLLFINGRPARSQGDQYDGHYDLRARDAAYLCFLMEDYLKTGKQPALSKTPESISRELFTGGKPCWRFNWTPCDAATHQNTNQRPCGWYQMATAPDAECN